MMSIEDRKSAGPSMDFCEIRLTCRASNCVLSTQGRRRSNKMEFIFTKNMEGKV